MVAAFSGSAPRVPLYWPALTGFASSFNVAKWTLLRCIVPVLALQYVVLRLADLGRILHEDSRNQQAGCALVTCP